MKRSIFTMLFVAIAIGAFAQMQVWSNGTIIFSHNANDVDSISFAGSPVKVQANTQAASSISLEGLVFINNTYSGGYGSNQIRKELFFISSTQGILLETYNDDSASSGNHIDFTYSISGNTINITSDATTITGTICGQNGLVLCIYDKYYPFVVWK